MRLPRGRSNKTKVDVNYVEQNGLPRVRLTLGEDGRGKKNTDMDAKETGDLITLLEYHKGIVDGTIPKPDPE